MKLGKLFKGSKKEADPAYAPPAAPVRMENPFSNKQIGVEWFQYDDTRAGSANGTTTSKNTTTATRLSTGAEKVKGSSKPAKDPFAALNQISKQLGTTHLSPVGNGGLAGSSIVRQHRSAARSAPQPSPSAGSDAAGHEDARGVPHKVVWDFDGEGEDELSVAAGEIVFVREAADNGWCLCECARGRKGHVPAGYVEQVRTVNSGPISRHRRNGSHGRSFSIERSPLDEPSPGARRPPEAPELPNEVAQKAVCALFDFHSQDDSELSMNAGDYLLVLENAGDGWLWCAAEDGREGNVPEAYVEFTALADTRVNALSTEELRNRSPRAAEDANGGPDRAAPWNPRDGEGAPGQDHVAVRALYEFEAAEDGELSIVPDEVLYVEQDMGDWLVCTNERGLTGNVPSAYVRCVNRL